MDMMTLITIQQHQMTPKHYLLTVIVCLTLTCQNVPPVLTGNVPKDLAGMEMMMKLIGAFPLWKVAQKE
jgi:hypothetical protein